MSIDATAGRARALWQELAAAPDAAFGTPGACVAPDSTLAPPSWVGVVTIGETALITAPTAPAADSVRTALSGLSADRLTDPATATALLPVSDTLGPAVLAAAGYAHWPRDTAHLCVLTAPDARGRGLARQVASEATAHALA
ncbi:GNAT family N-acetyltransferase, partial [Streptomyces cyaneofuscatus]|uniref:GNAT family N-acetyltransferase n=1 Tax=Streptomyces cyaneofuscatus TaxID=66883 RepID=UPI0034825CE0